MKSVKLLLVAALMALMCSACKTQTCPGYGEVETEQNAVEQNA